MSFLGSLFNGIMLIYFITHIPITIFVDSQIVIPRFIYPKWATEALDWHIATNGDYLVRDKPLWFMAFVYAEIYLQLPFFFYAVYAFWFKRNWIRIPAIVYGAHVSTTMMPILFDILFKPGKKNYLLAAIYAPYLLVPLTLLIVMLSYDAPFEEPVKQKKD